jgi:hypothetical protein
MAKCKVCRTEYKKWRMTQKVCGSVECAAEYARQVREKEERKELRARKEKLKTRRECINEAQAAFNAYIRARDEGKPCISCGAPWSDGKVGGSFDCGHYRSVGAAGHLRWTETNAAGQCKKCNRWGAGRVSDYRIGLIKRVGLVEVERLEADNTERRWTIEDAKRIKAEYKAKTAELIMNRKMAA